MVLLDKASFTGLLPHGKTRAGRSPNVHDVAIRPPLRPNPFQQIEDQRVNRHGNRRADGRSSDSLQFQAYPANPPIIAAVPRGTKTNQKTEVGQFGPVSVSPARSRIGFPMGRRRRTRKPRRPANEPRRVRPPDRNKKRGQNYYLNKKRGQNYYLE
jgi:hypothetical protein